MRKRLINLLRAWRGKDSNDVDIPSDTLGSYTGVPADKLDPPQQDADDL